MVVFCAMKGGMGALEMCCEAIDRGAGARRIHNIDHQRFDVGPRLILYQHFLLNRVAHHIYNKSSSLKV